MTTFDSGKAMQVFGVQGRLTHRTTKPGQAPGLWLHQKWISEMRPIKGYCKGAMIRAELRFDDECGDGHNTFSITGTVSRPIDKARGKGARGWAADTCLHEDIAKAFPELAPLIKWHLCSTDGPMHYVADTVYHASNRDHWGKLKGEPRSYETFIMFGGNPIKHKLNPSFAKFLKGAAALPGTRRFDLEVLPYECERRAGTTYKFSPKYTFGGFANNWHECPFDSESEALDFLKALQTCDPQFVEVATAWGEGKARDFAAARAAAIWPDATEAELSADKATLSATLAKRLPELLAAFRRDMLAIGFLWAPEDYSA